MELNRDLYIDGVSDYLEQQENLYNSSTDTTNSYINSEGEVISLSTWRVTDYIPVTPGSTFYYEGLINTGVAPMSAFYNSSKQFISSFKQVQGINNITIPSGASYIRFSLNNSDINIFKFDNRRYYGKYASKDYLENGKNLWNYNATNKIVGVTSTYNNSTLTLNGTATGEASNISHTNMVYLNAGTYTFKIVKESGSATGSQAIIFKNYTTNTNILNTTLNLSSGNTVTFTLENSAWVSLSIYFFASNVFTNLKLDIQLEKGSSATPYEKYYGGYVSKDYLEPLIDNLNSKTEHYISEIGLVSVTGASNQWGWSSITYTKTYETAPQIYLQEYANAYAPYQATVVQQTTTGCSVGIYNKPNETHRYMYMVVV